MSSKKKLIISLSAVAAVVLVAVIAVVAVLAATAQSVTSSITIRYVAADAISGTASAKFYVGNAETGVDMVNTANENAKILYFYANDGEGNNQVLVPPTSGDDNAIEMTSAEYAYVIFEYNFTNNGENDYTAKVTVQEQTGDSGKYQVSYSSDKATWNKTAETVTVDAISGNTAGTATYYIKVELPIADRGASYNFVANFVWALNVVGTEA